MKNNIPSKFTSRYGFTLIELSIVLVIVGLVIGGIMVGRDMIEAAQIRSAISQIEKIRTAVRTFQGKYGSLPGDISPHKAQEFGFQTRSGADSDGDENGLIDSCAGNSYHRLGCESALFWADLATMSLVRGNFNNNPPINSGYVVNSDNSDLTPSQIANYVPVSDITGNYILIWSSTPGQIGDGGFDYGVNNFAITGLDKLINPLGGYSLNKKISPYLALMIDTKIDDGMPQTGSVSANEPINGADNFYNYDSSDPCGYWVYNNSTNTPGCILQIHAGF
jgi:prepilin-type N-terminal cleavage/methylation domain-containing protein